MSELGIESATFFNVIDVSTVANVSTVVGTVASNVVSTGVNICN